MLLDEALRPFPANTSHRERVTETGTADRVDNLFEALVCERETATTALEQVFDHNLGFLQGKPASSCIGLALRYSVVVVSKEGGI